MDGHRYWAFISYSHEDRRWADWLHAALERYRVPRSLSSEAVEWLTPTFLDRAELQAGADLGSTLERALRDSRALVVVCSPSSARSQRVIKEIQSFRQYSDRVLPFIVAGRPNAASRGGDQEDECFPGPLRNQGTEDVQELLAADVRPGKGDRQEALLKLVAGILGVNLDQLRQRDARRRRRLWIGVTATVSMLAGAATALAGYAWQQRIRALEAQSIVLIRVADQRLLAGDVPGAQQIALELLSNSSLRVDRQSALNIFQEARALDSQMAVLAGHTQTVTSAAFSPDGKRVITASYDGTAIVWDAMTAHPRFTLIGHTNVVWDAQFSPDGRHIVTASNDHTARMWDATNGHLLLTITGHSDQVRTARFSPDGTQILTASWDGSIRLWDAISGSELRRFGGDIERISSASFSPDASKIVGSAWDKTIRIWDVASGRELLRMNGDQDRVESAAFSPDGKLVVSASWDRTARIWDALSGRQILVIGGSPDRLYSAAFSPDGMRVLTASYDKTARIWDAQTGQPIKLLRGHSDWIRTAAFSLDGAMIVTASNDHTARVWEVNPQVPVVELRGHTDRLFSVDYSPDGERLLTASQDKTARLWNGRTGELELRLIGHTDTVTSAHFSPDGLQVVTASFDKTVCLWDSKSAALIRKFSVADHLYSASLSPDGRFAIAAEMSGKADIWDIRNGAQVATLDDEGDDELYDAEFSPDGEKVVTASGRGIADLWDVHSRQPPRLFHSHTAQVSAASFSPTQSAIATGSFDKTARIWDLQSGGVRFVLKGHRDRLWSVRFSPSGKRLVTASNDGTARIWDTDSGDQLAVIGDFINSVNAATFSPDGLRIATASSDGMARVWSAKTLPLAVQILWSQAASFSPLSPAERMDLGLAASPDRDAAPQEASLCDQLAGAFYDPNRKAPGLRLEDIKPKLALNACAGKSPGAVGSRVTYQRGRARLAAADFSGAQKDLEFALQSGYPSAAVDLAYLLSQADYPDRDEPRAIKLYEQAWRQGVHIAAFMLGKLYEEGSARPDSAALAQTWYRRASNEGDPSALARLGELAEEKASKISDVTTSRHELVESFRLYSAALINAERQGEVPSSVMIWRARGASLARQLAKMGLTEAVAATYSLELQKPNSHIASR